MAVEEEEEEADRQTDSETAPGSEGWRKNDMSMRERERAQHKTTNSHNREIDSLFSSLS